MYLSLLLIARGALLYFALLERFRAGRFENLHGGGRLSRRSSSLVVVGSPLARWLRGGYGTQRERIVVTVGFPI